MFEFKILKKDKKNKARLAEFNTPHGKLTTPELAFVATEAELRAIPKEFMPKLPVNLIIVNTYHLWTKKIADKIYHLGHGRDLDGNTVHNYANFPKPIMSDSGGFQVFSLGFGKSQGVGKIANIFPDEDQKVGVEVLGIPAARSRGLSNPKRALTGKKLRQNLLFDTGNPLNISDEGVEFTFNEEKLMLSPEKSMQIQQRIGADIIFTFDECTSPLNTYEYTKNALNRTHEWLVRCIKQTRSSQNAGVEVLGIPAARSRGLSNPKRALTGKKLRQVPHLTNQALFAIVQGGEYEDLRLQSSKFMAKQNVPGFGIGGSLGMSKEDMHNILDWTIPNLPEEKPRHLLGIGQVKDIFECIERGVDTFDCVIPTREARHRVLYTKKGHRNIRKLRSFNEVIEKDCECIACSQSVTFVQLAQLFSKKDPRAFFYATAHNIQFYADLMKNIRTSIEHNRLSKLKEKYLRYYQ
ncbi:hypothetical protein A2767_02050 [Candidatus Roizmanbacteria bacterium RIFCSPHIGHO2_01_FULL_35_10]|uniref:tRNA-guanine(15) transglycosylase-like domain-containing protein n=1 Tax=Candidatus Roizmanbacteria bacterium RIFCSPLOWO2_01_FULL_35_13 TaxID=1802055 RepID=A0A1F7I7A1_9BACT|nr:MAG: hypothetical protein A2767_02050 [Candidatus Roizmanbacteria bacterium RIFCSPHIGHO2_01_FULL_35_10]OGK39244.1 MAG: hypothetical protein A3A74_07470 [Candidatus Roizmanbacteria bacterium RIFCSPLOWO2_01_FULL_35_13]